MESEENRSKPVASGVEVKPLVDLLWQEFCELPDRTSPEEYPDMALVTLSELTAIVETYFERADHTASQVAVKPLEWEKGTHWAQARCPALGLLQVTNHEGAWDLRIGSDFCRARYDTMEEAIAEVEEERISSILSALLPKATAPVVSEPAGAYASGLQKAIGLMNVGAAFALDQQRNGDPIVADKVLEWITATRQAVLREKLRAENPDMGVEDLTDAVRAKIPDYASPQPQPKAVTEVTE